MRISVAITAVPARLSAAQALADALEAQRGATGAFPWPIELLVDHEKLGCWGNARRAWLSGVARGSDAHLVIQDDVVLSQDFLSGAAYLHSLAPAHPMTFFRSSRVDIAFRANTNWILVSRFLMAQALLMPRDVLTDFVPWCDAYDGTEQAARWNHSCDGRQRDYFLSRKIKTLAPVPSLVDHGPLKSTLGNPSGRFARCFIGPDRSWQEINWESSVNRPVKG
jgi:hypothetical protein